MTGVKTRERERDKDNPTRQVTGTPPGPSGGGGRDSVTRNTFAHSSRKICKLPAAALNQHPKLQAFLKAFTRITPSSPPERMTQV